MKMQKFKPQKQIILPLNHVYKIYSNGGKMHTIEYDLSTDKRTKKTYYT
ncbi:hypothetical protein [Candidatus Phytoplasma meliae]|uniref:Uncharacterized protein n=1 Tax=Candidatus Phytoplasma meliae TaxID=1848402 RepID=A0ABS5CXP9_9MOLU|nr:hypothetical protein [Candidatus Phytoplasma meliae]MBP5835759.1 hypothetical protein [Candidatus Phytoplasma meliae]